MGAHEPNRGIDQRGIDGDFPTLYEMAQQFDFAERLGGSNSPILAEADRALRELWDARGEIERLRTVLREIGLPTHVPAHFDPLDFWKHTACKRGEIAREALGVSAEELIRDAA